MHCRWEGKMAPPLCKMVQQVFKKLKATAIWSSTTISGRLLKRVESWVLKTSLSAHPCSEQQYSNSQKVEATQVRCLVTKEWINKVWYMHTMECYSSLKRRKILTHAITWMNLENTMLSERSQSLNDKCVFLGVTLR